MTTIIPVLFGGKGWSGLQYSGQCTASHRNYRGLLGPDGRMRSWTSGMEGFQLPAEYARM